MTFGVIGVGHLAVSILKGLLRAGTAPEKILLSPRGYGTTLAERHGFSLAKDNAQVVAESGVVLLAVRPADALSALDGLPWRQDQVLLSACAGVSTPKLAGAAAPASIVRIMPLTASEIGASPTLVYPLRPEVEPYLSAIGSIIALETEDQFEVGTVSAAIYGWAQALVRESSDWSVANGLGEATARKLVAETFVASGRMIAESNEPMDSILESLCTPGGITEAGLVNLQDKGAIEAWRQSCEVVLERLRKTT